MTQRDRVLSMLREGPQTTASFLAAGIPRYSARILELRQAGYDIETERLRGSSFRFTLAPNIPLLRGAIASTHTRAGTEEQATAGRDYPSSLPSVSPGGALFELEDGHQWERVA